MTVVAILESKKNRDLSNLRNGRSDGLRFSKTTYVPKGMPVSIYGDPRGPDPRSLVSGRDNYWQRM